MRPTLVRAASAALLLLAAGCATARPATPAATSRPGIAKPAGTVAPGHFQLETGYSRAHQDGRTRHLIGETLVRAGVGPRTEVRAGWASYQRTVTDAATVEGAGDASLSVKHRFTTAAGWTPAFAITAGTTLPTGADRVSAGEAQPEGAVSAEWALPRGVRALGFVSHRSAIVADDRFGSTTAAVAGRVPLGARAFGHLEYVRTMVTREGAVDVDQLRAGAALRLTHDVLLDAFAGRAHAAGPHEYIFGIGLTSRW